MGQNKKKCENSHHFDDHAAEGPGADNGQGLDFSCQTWQTDRMCLTARAALYVLVYVHTGQAFLQNTI